MRFAAFAGSVCAACFLSACGGGSGGQVNSTLPPVATPGSGNTPTPTPSGGSNSTLVNLQVSESFGGLGTINRFTVASGTGATSNRQPLSSGQIQVKYDASAASYTIVTSTLPDASFGSANKSAADSTAAITAYSKTSGTRTDNLALFNPGAGNTQLALTYASYGGWQATTTSGTSSDVSTTFFVYGIKTAPGDLPKSGTATYKTMMDGLFAGNGGVYTLSGSSAIAADFAAGTVDFSLNPTGRNIVDGSTKTFGALLGSGAIASGTTGFTAKTDANSLNGYAATLAGQFFGPQAAEVGATFQLTGADGQGSGVVVGKKN
jgi:hypothetical protein